MKKILIIVGATASGKSRIGVDIAKKFNGEVVSCDSMQIYKHMNVGTAKITQEEMQGVPHHMIDIVDPKAEFSVGEYVSQADKIIDDIIARGKTAIVVGGTGLYVDGLLYPMTFGNNKDLQVRAELEFELQNYGKEHMHALLAQIDPIDAQKIHPNNTKRVLRALEIYRITGGCKSEKQEKNKALKYDCLMIALDVNRQSLYQKINSRVEKMIELGLLNEIKYLNSMGVNFSNQSMQAIGYKEFESYLNNQSTLDETIEIVKKNSRNYAKRQLTWFKRYDFAKWINPNDEEKIMDTVKTFLEGV